MGTIQTSTGLASGINTGQIIEQLLSIEARPRALAQQRLIQFQSQQAAFLDLNSSVLSLTTAAKAFTIGRLFRGSIASSSNAEALTATASAGAAVGSYSFVVDRLVSTDSRISNGFADRDSTGLGLSQLSFELGGGRLDSETSLENLNGGLGVGRGKISITDSAGESATIDLSRATTISDVLDAINSSSDLGVTASVDGYGITLTDNAGGGGTLTVKNVFGSSTASDLGIAGSAVAGVITGSQVQSIGLSTALSTLNDGNGITFGDGGPAAPADFVINVDGTAYNITLGEIGHDEPDPDDLPNTIYVVDDAAVTTVEDLLDRIESQTSGAVTAQISAGGAGIELVAPGSTITVSKGATGSNTAVDLGFIDRGSATNNDTDTLASRRLLADLELTALKPRRRPASQAAITVTADVSAFELATNCLNLLSSSFQNLYPFQFDPVVPVPIK